MRVLDGELKGVATRLPLDQHNLFAAFIFEVPGILEGSARVGTPAAPVQLKRVGPPIEFVTVDGVRRALKPGERIEIPVNIDAADVVRFLAKVAHAYAIWWRGDDACIEYLLPPIILGSVEGSLTYVGTTSASAEPRRFSGPGPHALQPRVEGQFIVVAIQLFRDEEDPPPVYEVVVGRLRK